MSVSYDAPSPALARAESRGARQPAARRLDAIVPYLLAMPLMAVFLVFFAVPIRDVFSEAVTCRTYLITVEFCAIVWVVTVVLGFLLAYFLAFQVRSATWQLVLLLLCTIPFWTSIVIRMIAWIPLLGRNGLVNQLLVGSNLTGMPQEWLLYSQFSVILGYVHLYALMMRIDRSLIEAASDAGATTLQVMRTVILPLARPGIAIGSIFVIAMVMGDFVTVDVLGGGQVASVGKQIATQLSYLQFPPAAATAMVLLVAVVLMVALLVRIVDIRKEL